MKGKQNYIYSTKSNIFRQSQRAGRSGEDRYLGMVEAAGSIPAQSTHFRYFAK